MLGGYPDRTPAARFIRPPANKLPPPRTTLTGLPAPSPAYQLLPLHCRGQEQDFASNTILADLPALPPPTVTGYVTSHVVYDVTSRGVTSCHVV